MGKARHEISRIFLRDQPAPEWTDQLRTSGAAMMMPIASACHRAHQVQANACGRGDCTHAAAVAAVAAIIELKPPIATNSTASSPRAKVRCKPMQRLTRAAAA